MKKTIYCILLLPLIILLSCESEEAKQKRITAGLKADEKRLVGNLGNNEFLKYASVSSKDAETTYYSYKTETYVETQYYGNISETRIRGGERKSKMTGVLVKLNLRNRFQFTPCKVKVKIEFVTDDRKEGKVGLGTSDEKRTYYGGKYSKKIIVKRLSPNSTTRVEQFFDTERRGKIEWLGPLFIPMSQSTRGATPYKYGSLKVKVIDVTPL